MKDYTSTTHDTDSFLQTKNLNLDTDVTRCPDIPVRSGHIGCVKLILDHCLGLYHGRGRFSGKDAHINMACQLDSPFALRLLLSQFVTDDELKSAVGAAFIEIWTSTSI
jgi:hypothetical protein